MSQFRYDSYCGLYCGACDTLIANQQGCLAVLAREWNRTPDELRCQGCKSNVNAVFCQKCPIRLCAKEKNIEFCYECPSFPCQILESFRNDASPHHSAVLKNLEDIKKLGRETWLNQQRDRWSCPECGTRFSWYDRTCVTCGANLFNCEAEEKTLPPNQQKF